MSIRPTTIGMRQRPVRRAFTLIELLIAMTLTLILVYAIAQFFSFVGETVRDGRAQTEMGGQLRAAFLRLRQDFAEMTVRVGGRIDYGQAMGCLEIWEGIASDSDPVGSLAVNPQGVPSGIVDMNAVVDAANDIVLAIGDRVAAVGALAEDIIDITCVALVKGDPAERDPG